VDFIVDDVLIHHLLQCCRSIRTLSIYGDGIDDEALKHIRLSSSISSLTSLAITSDTEDSAGWMYDVTAKGFCELIESLPATLKHLNITMPSYSPPWSDDEDSDNDSDSDGDSDNDSNDDHAIVTVCHTIAKCHPQLESFHSSEIAYSTIDVDTYELQSEVAEVLSHEFNHLTTLKLIVFEDIDVWKQILSIPTVRNISFIRTAYGHYTEDVDIWNKIVEYNPNVFTQYRELEIGNESINKYRFTHNVIEAFIAARQLAKLCFHMKGVSNDSFAMLCSDPDKLENLRELRAIHHHGGEEPSNISLSPIKKLSNLVRFCLRHKHGINKVKKLLDDVNSMPKLENINVPCGSANCWDEHDIRDDRHHRELNQDVVQYVGRFNRARQRIAHVNHIRCSLVNGE
jgi:hypothetical protein